MKDYFIVSRLHRDDIKAVDKNFPVDKIPDEEMEYMARKIGELMCETGVYWDVLREWAWENRARYKKARR